MCWGLIMGANGAGTCCVIDLIHSAVESENGKAGSHRFRCGIHDL